MTPCWRNKMQYTDACKTFFDQSSWPKKRRNEPILLFTRGYVRTYVREGAWSRTHERKWGRTLGWYLTMKTTNAPVRPMELSIMTIIHNNRWLTKGEKAPYLSNSTRVEACGGGVTGWRCFKGSESSERKSKKKSTCRCTKQLQPEFQWYLRARKQARVWERRENCETWKTRHFADVYVRSYVVRHSFVPTWCLLTAPVHVPYQLAYVIPISRCVRITYRVRVFKTLQKIEVYPKVKYPKIM